MDLDTRFQCLDQAKCASAMAEGAVDEELDEPATAVRRRQSHDGICVCSSPK